MSEKRFGLNGYSASDCEGVINYSVGALSGNYPDIKYSITLKAGWYAKYAGHGINYSNSIFKWSSGTVSTISEDVNWRSSGAGYSPWYAQKTLWFDLGNARSITKSASLSVSTYSPYNFNGSISVTSPSVESPTSYGLSISNITEKSVIVNHAITNKRNYWRVRLKDAISGKVWSLNSNTGNGTTTISSLTANTTYEFVIQVLDRNNQVCYTSSSKTIKTLGISKVGNTPTAVLGNPFVLVITGYSDSFTHTCSFTIGTYTFNRSGLRRGNVTIILTADEIDEIYKLMPNVKSLPVKILLKTYTGSTLIGQNTGNGTVQINQNEVTPIVTSFDYEDAVLQAIEITGNKRHIIQNVSKIFASNIQANVFRYATIVQYRLVIGGRTITSSINNIKDIVEVPSDTGITVQVVDSRGMMGTKTIQFDKYYAYTKPILKTLSARRKNSIERAIYLLFNGAFTTITVDNEKRNNACVASWCYKKTSDTNFSAYEEIKSFTDGSINFDNIVGELDDEYSFNVRVMIRDSVSYSTFDCIINKGIPDFCIGKNQASFGKPLELENFLDVAWPIKTPSIEIVNGIGGKGFRCGFVNITPKANTPTSVHVNAEFAKTPRVCVSAVSSVPGTTVLGVSAGNIDQSGFDIFVTRTNTTVTMIAWIAACEV